MRKSLFYISILSFIFTSSFNSQAEVSFFNKEKRIDYKILERNTNRVSTYLVDKIEFQGLKNLDEELVRGFINIKEKKSIRIPSSTIRDNIEKLLSSEFIEHVACYVSFVDDIHINLIFDISEFPIIEGYEFVGITHKKEEKLTSKIKFLIKKPASNKYLTSLRNKIKKFYVVEEGCIDFKFVPIDEKSDFRVILKIILPDIKKTYVNEIKFFGNNNVSEYFIKPELSLREKPKFNLFRDILYRVITLQPLKKDGYLRTGYCKEDPFRYFKNNVIFIPRTKFSLEDLKKDKQKILDVFSQYGYNDAEILKTKIKYYEDGAVDLEFFIDEGEKFFVNELKWKGNTKYETKFLNKIFNLKKGDVFSLSNIKEKTYGREGIISLYQDFGFLKSYIEPVVVGVDGNKVDLEMRIYEGDIYKINEVGIVGNTTTFDEVIRRKLFVVPGDTFSRSNILFSMQNLVRSGLFKMEDIAPDPTNINEKNKTTDVIFKIKRDVPQFRLEGGVSSVAGDENNLVRFNAGFKCNNVSILDLLKFKGFLGGGQNLNFAYHFYSLKKHSVDFEFNNPYLTKGKFPWGYNFDISVSFDKEHKDIDTNEQKCLNEFNVGVGFFKQLPWENGSCRISFKPNYKYYGFENYKIVPSALKKYDGVSKEFSLLTSFVRDTQDDYFFPKKGSRVSVNFTTTPPLGWFKKFDENASLTDRLEWRDYGLLLLEGNVYLNIWDDFVLMTSVKHGQNYSYSDKLVTNKFALGGGFANKLIPFEMLSLINVPLRGYSDNQFKMTADDLGTYGGRFFDVFSSELRFLLFDLSGMFKMYVLGFFDAGILYNDVKSLGIDDIKKSLGFGFRFLVPSFGVLGVDWGYGWDSKNQDKWEFHFQIGV